MVVGAFEHPHCICHELWLCLVRVSGNGKEAHVVTGWLCIPQCGACTDHHCQEPGELQWAGCRDGTSGCTGSRYTLHRLLNALPDCHARHAERE